MRGQMTLPAFRELPPERRAEQRARLMSAIARRPRRRPALAVALAVALLAVAPTFAFHRAVVDFFSGEAAPERIQRDFGFLREHTAEASARFGGPSYTPDGLAREVMTVMLDGERRPLWVVPTSEGGFCYRLHFHGSCLTPELARGRMPIGVGGLSTRHGHGFAWIVGAVTESSVQDLELLYQDGERVKVPFVWVSPPIDAGFYAYEVPEEHEQAGRLTVALIGLDEDGKEVAHACLRLPPDEVARSVPAAATLCERRQAAGLRRP